MSSYSSFGSMASISKNIARIVAKVGGGSTTPSGVVISPVNNSLYQQASVFAPTENADAYRSLGLTYINKKTGTTEQWMFGARHTPLDMLRSMNSDPAYQRTTWYDDSWFSMQGFANTFSAVRTEFYKHFYGVNYQSTVDYLSTLEKTYDFKDFLALLKLYRSAGIEIYPGYNPGRGGVGPFTKVSGYADTSYSRAWRHNLFGMVRVLYQPDAVVVRNPFSPQDDSAWLQMMRDTKIYAAAEALDPTGVINVPDPSGNIDYASIAAEITRTNKGYAYRNQLMEQIGRYRERVLAYMLSLTFDMLNAGQLEDLETLAMLTNHFVNAGEGPLNEISKPEYVQVIKPNGTVLKAKNGDVKFQANFSDFDEIDIVDPRKYIIISRGDGIPKSNPSYNKPMRVSIPLCLRMQAESAMWFFLANMNKYGARLDALLDHTTVLKNSGTGISFQVDPWKNPFLIFDVEKTRDNKLTPTFTDMATHVAPGGAGTVTSNFVSATNFKNAFTRLIQFTRVKTSTPGSFKSPFDAGGAGKDSSAWVLAAIAAAGTIYLMNK